MPEADGSDWQSYEDGPTRLSQLLIYLQKLRTRIVSGNSNASGKSHTYVLEQELKDCIAEERRLASMLSDTADNQAQFVRAVVRPPGGSAL